MPAHMQSGDPLTAAIQLSLDKKGWSEDIDTRLGASAKDILNEVIEFDEKITTKLILGDLKSMYKVLKTTVLSNDTNGSILTRCDQVTSVHKVVKDGVVPVKRVTVQPKETISLPTPKRVLFPLESVKIGWNGQVPIGSGFINLGNSCYLNSTLQALFHVPAFVNWLLTDNTHISKCELMNGSVHSECLICAMSQTIRDSHKNTGSAIKPIQIYTKLKLICKHMVLGHQEDAHEFLKYLIEGMEKSYLYTLNGIRLDSYSKETTPLNQIFGGYLRTEVTCLECSHVSTTFQHFQDLLLDIRTSSSVEEALEGYFCRERLGEGEPAYKCETCKKKVAATKKFTLERAPIVLCIALKRFGAMGGKNSKTILVKQQLDISKYRHGPSLTPLRYKLVSMVTHLGPSSSCGHYTAVGQSSGGPYYLFDDSIVRTIPLQNVLNTSGYILMYELDKTDGKVFPSLEKNEVAKSNGIVSNTNGHCTPLSGSSNGVLSQTCKERLTAKVLSLRAANQEKRSGAGGSVEVSPEGAQSSASSSGSPSGTAGTPGSPTTPTSIHSQQQTKIYPKFNFQAQKRESITITVPRSGFQGEKQQQSPLKMSPSLNKMEEKQEQEEVSLKEKNMPRSSRSSDGSGAPSSPDGVSPGGERHAGGSGSKNENGINQQQKKEEAVLSIRSPRQGFSLSFVKDETPDGSSKQQKKTSQQPSHSAQMSSSSPRKEENKQSSGTPVSSSFCPSPSPSSASPETPRHKKNHHQPAGNGRKTGHLQEEKTRPKRHQDSLSLVPYLSESSESSDSEFVPPPTILPSKTNGVAGTGGAGKGSRSPPRGTRIDTTGAGLTGWETVPCGSEQRQERSGLHSPAGSVSSGKWSVTSTEKEKSPGRLGKWSSLTGSEASTRQHNGSGSREQQTQRWDGSRHNTVVNHLLSLSHLGYGGGSSVSTWEGGKSEVESQAEDEKRNHLKRSSDPYNDEFDRGKVKKVKKYAGHKMNNNNNGGGRNRFQEYQNRNRNDYPWQSNRQKFYRDFTYEASHRANRRYYSRVSSSGQFWR